MSINENDLVYAVTAKMKELADLPLWELRLRAGSQDIEASRTAIDRENKHKTRGEMIEEIITEEFCVEFPGDFKGEESCVTSTHKILTKNRGWVAAAELTNEDELAALQLRSGETTEILNIMNNNKVNKNS